MTAKEAAALESLAESAAEASECGLYIVTLQRYQDYGGKNVFDCAMRLYRDMGFRDDGELLLLSMEERDYALVYHGYAEEAFSEYGRDIVEDAFLGDFHADKWYLGFSDYLSTSSYLLEQARAGNPIDRDIQSETSHEYAYPTVRRVYPSFGRAVSLIVLLPCLIAWIVCTYLKSQMKSVRRAAYAGDYTVPNTFCLSMSEDDFTHTTHERVRVERQRTQRDNDKQDTHDSERHSDGEFSGRSGKF